MTNVGRIVRMLRLMALPSFDRTSQNHFGGSLHLPLCEMKLQETIRIAHHQRVFWMSKRTKKSTMTLLRFTVLVCMANHLSLSLMGVKAYVPSTPASQHRATSTATSLKPPPALRPCHDINSDDPFFVLGLTTGAPATKVDIKQAYKSLVTFYHPDAIANLQTKEEKDEASSRFAKINAAYRDALGYLQDIEDAMDRKRREYHDRLERIKNLKKNDPFGWAVQSASLNRHETPEMRFEFASPAWKRGSEPVTESNRTRKVHIRRKSMSASAGTEDPFNWATAVVTGW